MIERVARGIYINVDIIEDTYFTTQAIYKKGAKYTDVGQMYNAYLGKGFKGRKR